MLNFALNSLFLMDCIFRCKCRWFLQLYNFYFSGKRVSFQRCDPVLICSRQPRQTYSLKRSFELASLPIRPSSARFDLRFLWDDRKRSHGSRRSLITFSKKQWRKRVSITSPTDSIKYKKVMHLSKNCNLISLFS